MMSGSCGVCPPPFLPPAAVQWLQFPQFLPIGSVGMNVTVGFGMGMVGLNCSAGPPVMSVPSPPPVTRLLPAVGLPAFQPMLPAQHMPLCAPPGFPSTVAAAPAMSSNPNQAGSQMHSSITDGQQAPTVCNFFMFSFFRRKLWRGSRTKANEEYSSELSWTNGGTCIRSSGNQETGQEKGALLVSKYWWQKIQSLLPSG